MFEEFSPEDPANAVPILLDYNQSCVQTVAKQPEISVQPPVYHLTPPQSPPELLCQQDSPFSPIWQTCPAPVAESSDIYQNLYVVDEIVQNAVQNIAWQEPPNDVQLEEMKSISYPPATEYAFESPSRTELPADFQSQYNVVYSDGPSPASFSPSSPSSSSCSNYGSSENDDDWVSTPEKSKRSKGGARAKPYSRSSDDKKSRKKEQNKNAATRYRQKKKAEIEILMGEEKELQAVNDDLTTQVTDVKRQVAFLKNVLREVFTAKGLL